jgi:hypothetical protein
MIDSQLRKQEEDDSKDEEIALIKNLKFDNLFTSRLNNSIMKYQPSFNKMTDYSQDFPDKLFQESLISFIDLVNELELNYNPLVTIEKPSTKATPKIEKKKKTMKSKIKNIDCHGVEPKLNSNVRSTTILHPDTGSKEFLTTNYSSRGGKKQIIHKASPSLPEFNQHTFKITDVVGTPSVIKTNGNTHILINNNFFNYEPPTVKEFGKLKIETDDTKFKIFESKLNSHRYNTVVETSKVDCLSPKQKQTTSNSKPKVTKFFNADNKKKADLTISKLKQTMSPVGNKNFDVTKSIEKVSSVKTNQERVKIA